MLTKSTFTEKLIRGISAGEEYFYYPKTVAQAFRWVDDWQYRSHKRDKAHAKRIRRRIQNALRRLEKTNYLSCSKDTGGYKLTSKGWLKYLYYYSRHQIGSKKRSKGAGEKKYVIIFDIPEAHRRFRDLLRQSLKNQGSSMLQKSVFSCPDEEVFLWAKKVVSNCELDGHVLFIEADKIH